MIVCVLGLCVAIVLLQEQRKLKDTGASTGVSTLTILTRSLKLILYI